MNVNILRTLQIGAALAIVGAVTVAVLVITGVLSRDAGVGIVLDVAAVIGVCVAAAVALLAVFAIGDRRRRGASPPP